MTSKIVRHSPNPPNAHMRMSAEARNRMRATEKIVLHYYNDMGRNKGNCTWGSGILAHRGVCSEEELARKVTLQNVETEFDRRVAEAERYVKGAITRTTLNQAQFDALVSLTYNSGVRNMRGTYDLVNQGNFDAAAANISRMVKVTFVERGRKKEVVAPGLIRRRKEESAPFRIKASP